MKKPPQRDASADPFYIWHCRPKLHRLRAACASQFSTAQPSHPRTSSELSVWWTSSKTIMASSAQNRRSKGISLSLISSCLGPRSYTSCCSISAAPSRARPNPQVGQRPLAAEVAVQMLVRQPPHLSVPLKGHWLPYFTPCARDAPRRPPRGVAARALQRKQAKPCFGMNIWAWLHVALLALSIHERDAQKRAALCILAH